jgi:hypothetical protein
METNFFCYNFLQTFLRRFVALDVQMIVKGPCRHASVKFYQQYLDHIWQQVQVAIFLSAK